MFIFHYQYNDILRQQQQRTVGFLTDIALLLAQDIILLVVKYKHNIAMIKLRAWCKHSYLLIHILKLNPIKTGNLAKQVSSTC